MYYLDPASATSGAILENKDSNTTHAPDIIKLLNLSTLEIAWTQKLLLCEVIDPLF
jgi:hypothetical protein